MAWTPRQQEAIEKRNTDLLVSAAAGSGKTSVLVERVRRLVMEENVSIDSMLIVTFTNAAAAEMKERIYAALTKELSSPDLGKDRKAYLRNQLSLIGRANICTFHKFALEIVHRYYHVIGIAPGLAICDDGRRELIMREAMDELMESRYQEGGPDFRAFLDCFSTSKGDEPAREAIRSFHRFLESLAEPESWMEEASGSRDFAEAGKKYIDELTLRRCDLAVMYFEKAQDLMTEVPKLAAKNGEDLEFAGGLLDIAKAQGLEGVLPLISGYSFKRMSPSKDEKEVWADLKAAVGSLRDAGKRHLKYIKDSLPALADPGTENQRILLQNIIDTLISLTKEFSSRYDAKKAQLGLLDFADAEHYALRILKDEEVCREYRDKFSCIFVDEYQDSNAVQECLIAKVSRGSNVFRVGDVKQSIYKFRQAQPELFMERYAGCKSGELPGEVIDLNSNFRSKKEVIDLVNRIFENLMTKSSAGMDYTEDEALRRGSSYEGPIAYRPKLYLIDTASMDLAPADPKAEEGAENPAIELSAVDSEIEELKSAELEAVKAASIIREYHGKLIHDDKKNVDRPLEFRDMAVLMRATKTMGEVFYRVFTEAGIPVYMERSEGYFDAVEIQVFLNLLKIIDNCGRDIPLLSVLCAPVFGFCAEELADVRIWAIEQGERRREYNKIFREYAEKGPEGPLKTKCRAFLDRLERWQLEAKYTPLADFIWQLLNETGYSVFAASCPSGEQRLANLRALADKAAAYESENSGGLFGFISYVEAINSRKGKVGTGLAGVLSENADVVRIMTVHKSKGLEFPFVLLSGLGKKFGSGGNTKAVFHKDFGLSLKLSNPKNNLSYEPASFRLIKAKMKAEDLAEEIRVLYVALTRPKDIVVMTAAAANPQSLVDLAPCRIAEDVEETTNFLSMILPAAGNALDIIIENKYSLFTAVKEEKDSLKDLEKGLNDGFPVEEELLPLPKEELRSRLSFSFEPEKSMLEKRKYSVSQIAAMEKKVYKRPPRVLAVEMAGEDGAAEVALDAAERGTAYHGVMEHIAFTPEGKSPEEIRGFIDGLAASNILTAAEAKVVDERKIAAFFKSDTGKRVLASREVHKEASFTMRHEYGGRPVLVQGTIDCYFEEDGGWVLVDYKTNRMDKTRLAEEEQRLRDEYLPQLDLYRKALEGSTGKPVKKAVLYLFEEDKEISIDN